MEKDKRYKMLKKEEIDKALNKIGIPEHDLYDLPTSEKTFPDECNYRIEVSGISNIEALRALIDEMEKMNVPIHRLIMGRFGIRMSKEDLREYAKLAKEAKVEVFALAQDLILIEVSL